MSWIGSSLLAHLRLLSQADSAPIRGDEEILGFAGSLYPNGVHLHIAIDAELLVGLLTEYWFHRVLDSPWGYAELLISSQALRSWLAAAGPFVAQQLHDRHRAGTDTQAARQKAAEILQAVGIGLSHQRLLTQ